MRRGNLILGLVAVFGAACRPQAPSSRVPPGSDARIARLEEAGRRDDARLARLEDKVADFQRRAAAAVRMYERAASEFEAARRSYERARAHAVDGQTHYAAARAAYEEAQRNWRIIAATIVAAAAWDQAGLLCETRMTTQQYRKILREKGIDLEGLDVDHVLPRSLGGADHPANYKLLDSSLNRALGNRLAEKLVRYPLPLLQGLATTALMRLRCSPQK